MATSRRPPLTWAAGREPKKRARNLTTLRNILAPPNPRAPLASCLLRSGSGLWICKANAAGGSGSSRPATLSGAPNSRPLPLAAAAAKLELCNCPFARATTKRANTPSSSNFSNTRPCKQINPRASRSTCCRARARFEWLWKRRAWAALAQGRGQKKTITNPPFRGQKIEKSRDKNWAKSDYL